MVSKPNAACAHELDEVVERVEVGQRLEALGQLVDREEGARHQEQRRDHQRGHVVELVDLGHRARHGDAEGGEAEGGDQAEEGHEQHPPRGVEAEAHRHQQREAAVEAGPQPDPEHLGGHELLDVDRGGEDRVVGALEAVLDEGAEHRGQRAGEDHRRGHHARADELDVVEPVDLIDDRGPEADPEGQQVDDRLEHAGERGRLPEGAEVGHLAAHHAGDRRRLEPPHSASSPVRSTKTSSSEAARLTASGGTTPSSARSAPTIATAGPAGRTTSPCASAAARTSVNRSGGP